MKRFAMALLVMVALGIFSSCDALATKDEIGFVVFTADQKEIADVFSSTGHELLLFDMQTGEGYTNFDAWIEVYKDGKMAQKLDGMSMYNDTDGIFSGRIRILQEKDGGNYRWRFSLAEGGVTSHMGDVTTEFDIEGLQSGGALQTSPQNIQKGEEIVLYSAVFSRPGDIVGFSEMEVRADGYPAAFFIKCKFS